MRGLVGKRNTQVFTPSPDAPPFWTPGLTARAAFAFRDFLNWPQIEEVIQRHGLHEVDLIQLDSGLDFTRDARFAKSCADKGIPIVSFYHGSDMRNRGIVRAADSVTSLRLTSEWDLLEFDPRLEYLYLPFDTSQYPDHSYAPHSPVRICHAARNPYKGTKFLVEAVERLSKDFEIELVLLRDLSHAEALRRKAECDIFVDQLTNEGGWGYGMSSVEALAMGLPVLTNIPPQMESRIALHPFIQADQSTIHDNLRELLSNPERALQAVRDGQQWVREHHDVRHVVDHLYSLYEHHGWLKQN
jgi:glycosyltransferase involved in cell wall biosynthesis